MKPGLNKRIILTVFGLSLFVLLYSVGCGSHETQKRFATPRTDSSADVLSQKTPPPPASSTINSSDRADSQPQEFSSDTNRLDVDIDELIAASRESDVMSYLGVLASEEMEGRAVGTEGSNRAARYIADQFQTFGLKSPSQCTPPYYQMFFDHGRNTQNIIGILEGKSSSKAIVIGAHYDHLGTFESNIYYGADDNASGVAVLLYLAKQLGKLKSQLEKTIIFISFSGEESGLLGSSYYVKNPVHPLAETSMMFNFDMVGYYKRGGLRFIKRGDFSKFDLNIKSYCDNFSLRCSESSSSDETSDHLSFYQASIPSILVHTGTHIYQHTFEDKVSRIDSQGILKIANASLKIIWNQAWQKTPDLTSSFKNNYGIKELSSKKLIDCLNTMY